MVADFPKTAFILRHAGSLEVLCDTGGRRGAVLMIGAGQLQLLNLGWVALPVL